MLFCFESSFLVSFFFASNLDSCFKLWPESFASFADLFQPDYLVVIAVYLIVAPQAEIVRSGRTRWKVENENNNTLKTKGYNLEHNFGHGKQHLASFLATLNILSLLFHTLLERLDEKYKLLRSHWPTRKTFFDDLRALTRYLYFENWDHLLTFMLEGLELEIPPNTS